MKLKQLFCKHVFVTDTNYIKNNPNYAMLHTYCAKCHKEDVIWEENFAHAMLRKTKKVS